MFSNIFLKKKEKIKKILKKYYQLNLANFNFIVFSFWPFPLSLFILIDFLKY